MLAASLCRVEWLQYRPDGLQSLKICYLTLYRKKLLSSGLFLHPPLTLAHPSRSSISEPYSVPQTHLDKGVEN